MITRNITRISNNSLKLSNRSFIKSISGDVKTNQPPTQGAEPLNWEEFLAIRKSRHRYDMIASVPTTLTAFFAGAGYFATKDPTQTIFGLDALLVYSGASLGCGAFGWLLGPTLGSSIWKLLHRSRLPEIEIKERVFYQHIIKNRVDPSRQSVQNPVPDYYGEHVNSLRSYRQWLRDQAAFRRKAYLSENE